VLPVIDMTPWWAGDERGRASVAAAVDRAATDVGFFQLTGHGVLDEVVQAAREVTDTYFALPLAEKQSHRPGDPAVNRGYAPRNSESLAYSLGDHNARPTDLFEAFNVSEEGWPDSDRTRAARAHDIFAPNLWPDRPAGFRQAVVAYFDALRSLAYGFAPVVATALGLAHDHLDRFVDHSTTLLRIVNYETGAEDPEPDPGQLGMGAHTDYGLFTILYADPVPGLQLLAKDGRWHDAVPEPGAFVVNIGDLLARWTNDRWRSTLHRVSPPARPRSGTARRRSMAFFFDGNWDAVIEPLPTCVSTDRPARYGPVIAGEHLMAKLLGPRTLQASRAGSTVGEDRSRAIEDPTGR